MPVFFKKIPFHFLLIPLFFCLFKLNESFALIPAKYSLELFAYFLAISFGVFFIGKILLKNNLKAAFWTTIVLLIFFFFGFTHDLLRSLKLPPFLVSYKFLLPALFLLLTGCTIAIRKSRIVPVKTTYYLNLLFSLFILVELGRSAYKTLTHEQRKNNYAYNNTPLEIKLADIDSSRVPDIFFIVFDEYPSSVSLEKYLGFDNSKLDSLLSGNHFYINRNSRSNYNSTPYSLASTFNLDYFNLPLENEWTEPKVMTQGKYTYKKSLLPGLLAEKGYRIVNHGFFDMENYPAGPEKHLFSQIAESMMMETLWGRVRKEIWWNVLTHVPSSMERKKDKMATELIEKNISNFTGTLGELKIQDDHPKFVMGHIMMPHPDFLVDRHGMKRKLTPYDCHEPLMDSLFLDQLRYTNSWIDSLIKASPGNFKRPRVIIIEGDHGYRENHHRSEKVKCREKEFMNLSTFYFSDQDYSILYDGISPVNSFRVVLNKYFHTTLPLLKDSTVFLY